MNQPTLEMRARTDLPWLDLDGLLGRHIPGLFVGTPGKREYVAEIVGTGSNHRRTALLWGDDIGAVQLRDAHGIADNQNVTVTWEEAKLEHRNDGMYFRPERIVITLQLFPELQHP